MINRDIIVIGASAGGVDALQRLCAALPADLDAAVFIAQHLSPSARSLLPQILARSCVLPVICPVDEQPIEKGHVYIAAPDLHMLVRPGRILMRRGPYENRTRPAVNALFRSAAVAYGSRVTGVVLTGLLDDGTEGLIAIKAAGGMSVVQDPEDAEWPSMPRNAVMRDHVDEVAPLAALASILARLASEPPHASVPLPEEYLIEDRIASQDFAVMETDITTPGNPSRIACPDCGGVLNQIEVETEVRFRCQVGHAYTPLGLAEAQSSELERALGIAVRTHRDRIKLFDQMRDKAATGSLTHAVARWDKASAESAHMVGVLEQAMATLKKPITEGVL
jgi:two-component system chemotaxis response regulator CheB